jgi:deoxycytidylate deaminase
VSLPRNLSRSIETSFAFLGRSAPQQRCRHFSFIFDRGKLVSMGLNSYKTHPKNLKYNYVNRQNDNISSFIGTHSELNAVVKFGDSCKGLTMVNTRINRNNRLDFSCPCKGCLDMLVKMGFKDIFYTTKSEKFDHMVFSDDNYNISCLQQHIPLGSSESLLHSLH